MSDEPASHDHTHGMAKQTLRLAFFLSLIIVAAEVIGVSLLIRLHCSPMLDMPSQISLRWG